VLATGLSPLDGILVPTFGAFYVAVTLLFPFVAIRALGREKETGTLRLLVQLPYRAPTLIAAKAAAVIIRIVLISVLPMGYRAAEHTAVSPDGEEAQRGVKFLNSRDRFVGDGGSTCGIRDRRGPVIFPVRVRQNTVLIEFTRQVV